MSTADAPLPTAPTLAGPPPHLLVVRAPYYAAVVDGLRDGATRLIAEAGATCDVLDVSGALELAGAIRLASIAVTPPVTYENGDVTQYVDVNFRCRYVSGDPYPADGENLEVRWFPIDALPPMSESQAARLAAGLREGEATTFVF